MNHVLRITRAIDRLHEGGVGSGNWGRKGRPGQVGGSAPTDTSLPVHQRAGFQHRILSGIAKQGGITIGLRGDVPHVGYVVGGGGEEFIKPWADLQPSDVNEYVNRNIGALTKANHYFGAWVDGPKVYFDVSSVRTDKDEALAEGRDRNQLSIWDLKGGKAYDTKTGEVYMSEAEQRSGPALLLFGKDVSAEAIVAAVKKEGQRQLAARGRRMITITRKD